MGKFSELKPIDEKLDTSPLRFYVLGLFATIQFCQSIMFAFYTCIPDDIVYAYRESSVTNSDINMSVSLGSLSIIFIIPFMTFIDNYFNSARVLMLTSCTLTLISLIFRIIPHWADSQSDNVQVYMYLSSIIVNFASIFSNALPALVSSIWFPANERVIATGVGTEALSFGDALTYLVLPYVIPAIDSSNTVESRKKAVGWAIFFNLMLTVLVTLLTFISLPAKPKHYPSIAIREKERRDEDYFKNIYNELYGGSEEEGQADEEKPLMPQPVNNSDEQEPEHKKYKYTSARQMLPTNVRVKEAWKPFLEMLKFFVKPHMLLVGLLAATWYGACGCWGVEVAILFQSYGSYSQFGSTICCLHLILNTFGAMISSTISQKFPRNEKNIMLFITTLNTIFVIFFIFTFGFGDAESTICVNPDDEDDWYPIEEGGDSECGSSYKEYETFKVMINLNKYLLAALVCVHGLFAGALLPMWYDVAAQMAYPISAGTTGGYIFFTTAIGIFLVALFYSVFGDGYINLTTAVFLVITLVLLLPLKIDYKREAVERETKAREEEEAKKKQESEGQTAEQ